MSSGRFIAASLAVLAAALIGLGCGSGDSTSADLPPETATAINDKLDEVQKRFEAGKCEGSGSAESSLDSLREAVGGTLLEDADEQFVSDLNELMDNLGELIAENCDPDPVDKTTSSTAETTDTIPETTDTTPTTTDTTPTTTDTTTTKSTTTTTTTPEPPTGPPGNPGGGNPPGGGVIPGGGNNRAGAGPGAGKPKPRHGDKGKHDKKERSR